MSGELQYSNNLDCGFINVPLGVSIVQERLADAGVQLLNVFPLVNVGSGGVVLHVSENALLVHDPSSLPRDLGVPEYDNR